MACRLSQLNGLTEAFKRQLRLAAKFIHDKLTEMISTPRSRTGLIEVLIARFKRLYDSTPSWAWPYRPSCPLVGQSFMPGESLLVYASAENLNWMMRHTAPPRFNDERAWNRYRVCYEDEGLTAETFFPDIGIQPVTNGGLFAAALFVADRSNLPTADTPRDFLERVAFTNWCKFSVKTGSKRNGDYVHDLKKLTESLVFVETELAVLHPKVVLVPKAIWQWPSLQTAMRSASPLTQFVQVPQFNATVVNCHLGKFDESGQQLQHKLQGSLLAEWMQNLERLSKGNAWRYIALLDGAINDPQ